jgi:hypothetical protein
MVSANTKIHITAWLTASVGLAKNSATSLAKIQERVDSMTDPLSESGHRLAGEVSSIAMQINMFRSLEKPLPQWSEAEAKNPEGTLRELAVQIFQKVGRDTDAMNALMTSGELFMERNEGGAENVDKISKQKVHEIVRLYYEDNDEEYFWGSGSVRDKEDLKWRTDSALKDMRAMLEERFHITGLFITQFDREHIEKVLLDALIQLGRLED